MAFRYSKLKVWSCELEDRPGSLSEKLSVLANAGANLEFVSARRDPKNLGKGILYVASLKGKGQERVARENFFETTAEIAVLRLEGPNRPGLGHRIADAVAQQGVNLQGLTASVVGNRFVCFLCFDSYADAERSLKKVKKLS